jgi:hypothetical protein
MITLYALLLAPVALAIVGLLLEEASKVGRPFTRESSSQRSLNAVITADRRAEQLKFVGRDRREIPLTVEAALAYAELRRGA